ncbi:DsbA family protein [Gordonia amicalis]|uniref:Thioredoxin domain-containing protein n=1 Tax=Gordonia amicalis TaxID=89053 RepID=A0ABU4DD20_9ACTN|nr:thioredoxin domain-containing protein [Gordonia amicalis]MDV6307634.1 thioredoxin domain-containing protein [Gordonia amicalis]
MTEKRSPVTFWLVAGVIVATAIALIAFVVVIDSDDPQPPARAGTDSTGDYLYDIGLERRDPQDPLALGRVDAPVTLIVFTDYQCPFCAKWSHDTLPTMIERAEAGELRIEFRDVNVFGEASTRAARAAYAAALQGRFLDYHHALYPEGRPRKGDGLSTEGLIATSAELGLDVDRFRSDMESTETRKAIAENEELGAAAGAYSTPSFILGGQPIAGAQPTEVFVDALDELTTAEGN